MKDFPSKTIHYRGGVVTFEIPVDWVEEYEPEGGGMFYDDRPDSGTLRLHVLSFTRQDGVTSDKKSHDLLATEEHEVLPSGFLMRRYRKEADEDGEKLHLYRWEVSVPVPPAEWRLACFSHTVVAGQEEDPQIQKELELIDRLVRRAEYSTAHGEFGPYHHNEKEA